MAPPQPPLPTINSLLFQFSGSQISAPISESELGLSLTTTRQNVGSSCNGRGESGGVKLPAATVCAKTTCALAEVREKRLSQPVACAPEAKSASTTPLDSNDSRMLINAAITQCKPSGPPTATADWHYPPGPPY